jgi:5'-3' exonuclease
MSLLLLALLLPAVSFGRGRPFKPFEQLLAVLPSASCTY